MSVAKSQISDGKISANFCRVQNIAESISTATQADAGMSLAVERSETISSTQPAAGKAMRLIWAAFLALLCCSVTSGLRSLDACTKSTQEPFRVLNAASNVDLSDGMLLQLAK
jgi:hypothetical protein